MRTDGDASLWRMLENMRASRFGRRTDSAVSRNLLQFYPDKDLSYEHLVRTSLTRRLIADLVRDNSIVQTGDPFDRQYRLTLQGRCRVLCDWLGVRFLELCIISEAYAMHQCQARDGCRSYYPINEAYEAFGEIYTKKHVQNTMSGLCAKGFVARISSGMLGLTGCSMEKLARHDGVLIELHEWIASIPSRLNVLSIRYPSVLTRVKRA